MLHRMVGVWLSLAVLGLSGGCALEGSGTQQVPGPGGDPADGGGVGDDASLDAGTPDAQMLPGDAEAVADAEPVVEVSADASLEGCASALTTSGFYPVCGPMARERWDHDAALLPDGRVVLVGGYVSMTGDHDLDVEVYDPATRTFAVVAQLIEPRVGHRATALADGRVLITGGSRSATTEIFDPATDTMAAGPDLHLSRSYHTATLLADGRVLVTGGYAEPDPDDYSEGNAVAEVFDPATNVFVVVGPMTHERHEHEAVRLHDGRVLLTGGADAPSCCDDGISETELFDPATNTFAATGRLVVARPAHRTTRLADGRVLVTGGSVAHGGADGPTDVEATEIYDPATATFASTGAMATAPGTTFTVTRLGDGRVLAAGGNLGDRAEVYTPAAGTWSTLAARMIEARALHTATVLLDGTVLLVGGRGHATAELYVP